MTATTTANAAAPPRPRRRTRLRMRLLVAAVVGLGTLVVLEVGLRVGAHLLHRQRGVGYSEHLGWHMLPGVEKKGEFWSAGEPARTNSHGWRDAEATLDKPEGVRRIVALGDSFTFGQGVDYGQRFTEVLEQRFERLEVINMGASAFGTDQELLAFETEGKDYRPDVVVLTTFLGNDLDDIRADRLSGWSKPYFVVEGDELRLVPPHKDWTTSLRTASYLAEVVMQLLERGRPSTRRAPEWRSADTVPLFGRIVARLQRAVEAQGAKLLVVLAHAPPLGGRWQPDPTAGRVTERLRQQGVAVLDTGERLHGAAAPVAQLYLPCRHWSAAGHRIVGDLIADELRRRGWL